MVGSPWRREALGYMLCPARHAAVGDNGGEASADALPLPPDPQEEEAVVRRNTQLVTEEKVRSATGHGREHWFALLDAAGARSMGHTAIARLLAEQGVGSWWAQGITVAYEQERGLRAPGQLADGTFQVSISRTLAAPPGTLWPLLDDDTARAAWLGFDWPATGRTPHKSLRLRGPGESRVTVACAWPGADGSGKARVSVQHSGLGDPEELERFRALWRAALGRLADAAAGAASGTAAGG